MGKVIYWGGASLVLIATYVILRVLVRRDYQVNKQLTLFSSVLEWVLILIWVIFSSAYLPADWPIIHVPPFLQVFAWIWVGGGVAGIVLSMAWLGWRRSHGLQVEGLMQSGPYQFTRNPQIVAFMLAMLGFTLLWPSGHMLVSLLLVGALAHLMVLTEEEHLHDVQGAAYQQYCQRVPRYLRLGRRKLDSDV